MISDSTQWTEISKKPDQFSLDTIGNTWAKSFITQTTYQTMD